MSLRMIPPTLIHANPFGPYKSADCTLIYCGVGKVPNPVTLPMQGKYTLYTPNDFSFLQNFYGFRTYIIESANISAIAYCIKLEVDISKRTSFGLKKIGLRGNTIWHEPRKVSEISQKNKARA